MKYRLKIVKVEEPEMDDNRRFMVKEEYEVTILQANISPDATIELMQHLLDLQKREGAQPDPTNN